MSEHPIDARWAAVRSEGRAALVAYLTAGYPDRAATISALRMLEEEGVDFIEVGIPFSDPLADGPVIQRSSFEALARGASVAGTLSLVREAGLSVPLIAFTYLNPVLAFGVPRFLEEAREAGFSGLLLTDLPVGADPALEQRVMDSPLAMIRLLAPTTDESRLAEAAHGARGFLYLIARLGVTGARTIVDRSLEDTIARVRRVTSLPLVVGFGIAQADQVRRVSRLADGVVVGSALVERLKDGIEPARRLVRELRGALGERSPAGAVGR